MPESKITNLLIRLLFHNVSDELIAELKQLGASQWEELAKLSGHFQIAPFIYKRLEGFGCDITIPESTLELLKKSYLLNLKKNIRLHNELGIVLANFNEANLPVIVLKGAHLCEAVYGNIGLRSMSDIDILVRDENLEKAGEVLEYLEYELQPRGKFDLSPHYVYHPDTSRIIPIELHWHLLPLSISDRMNIDAIWDRSVQMRLAGVNTLSFSPEDAIIHAATHLAYQHRFDKRGLRTILDIKTIIDKFHNNIDWKYINKRSLEWRISRSVFTVLSLTNEMSPIHIPDFVLGETNNDRTKAYYTTMALERIFAKEEIKVNLTGGVIFALGGSVPGNRLKLVIKRFFFTPNEMRKLYSLKPDSKLVFLYYIRRIFDLIRRNWRSILSVFGRGKEYKNWKARENQSAVLKDWLLTE
ncbi:nucleotidyltransferase family protein [bacterium]|nr:nucleotidyltransferase family protein [bacterium]